MSQAEAVAETFERFRDGQPQAVEVVRGWIASVLHGGNWRFPDPEGVGQEILLKLLQIVRADRVRDTGSFQKFVYSVAKNTCVKVYHGERRRAAHENPQSFDDDEPVARADDPDVDLERQERVERFAYILQQMPEACRQLWDWVYRKELSAAEVGEKLGISVNNVRVRVHRCLQKARAIHEAHDTWPQSDVTARRR